MTVELKNLIREEHRLKECFDKYPLTFGDRYRAIRNKVDRSLKQCKRNYFKEKFISSTNNPKKSYDIINEALERQPRNNKTSEITVNGKTFKNKDDVANAFSYYFSEIGTSSANNFTDSIKYHMYIKNYPYHREILNLHL